MVHISHSSAFFLFFHHVCSPSFIHHCLPPSTVSYKTHQEMEPNPLPVMKLAVDDDDDDNSGGEEEGEICGGGEFGFKKKKKLVFAGGSGKKESAGRGGGGGGGVSSPPRCQAEKCAADLMAAKRYHRRHKVCESHAKASAVVVSGVRQRFCQQCSRS